MLKDPHQRTIRKLRVSVTEMCNFRCFYCMPYKAVFIPQEKYLSAEEIGRICGALVEQGIAQIRVTGGEPTFRKDFDEIISRLSDLPVDKLAVTTNGYCLEQHLEHLLCSGCRHLNISLDSLDKEKFNRITHSGGFDKVLHAILSAKEMGFEVKINMLLLKGINDDELLDFVAFSAKNNLEVRFMELMKIGLGCKYHNENFMSAQEALQCIQKEEFLTPAAADFDATSFNFAGASGAKIGFIASETKPFCASCSRLRLTATGVLRACLMSDRGVHLRGVPKESYPALLKNVLEMKPMERISRFEENIYQIGG